ncbi:MAG: dihydrofolate reductase family protein [Solirubrobacterales bacterium]
MAKLTYAMAASLDGYVEDEQGSFAWAKPDEEVHRFVNERERDIGTYLLGRRMYETMAVWETDPLIAQESEYMREYAEIWQGVDKVVYSRTLDAVPTRRTRLEREFDPDAIRALKASAERNLAVAGPNLASSAFEAGLVDEIRLLIAPAIVGAGKPVLPAGARVDLELVEERRLANGMVHLRYRARD